VLVHKPQTGEYHGMEEHCGGGFGSSHCCCVLDELMLIKLELLG